MRIRRTAQQQRENRATEGHYLRESMIRWRTSESGIASKAKYQRSEHGRAVQAKTKAKGTEYYKRKMAIQRESISKASNGRLQWTSKDETSLRDLQSNGVPYREIGLMLGRSEKSVAQKVARLGLVGLGNTRQPATTL